MYSGHRPAKAPYPILIFVRSFFMSKIIAVTSGKGGTGKSSICAGLGFALAKKGHRTLIVELDIGLRCLDIMCGMKDSIPYDLGDILDGNCDIYKATAVVKSAANLNLICAPSDPYKTITAEQIKDITDEIRKYFEYIIIDTSAGINNNVFDIVARSDMIVIVTTPDPICVRDAQMMSDEFYKRGNQKQRLIINKVGKNMFNHGLIENLDEIIDSVGVQLIGVIPEENEFSVATANGVPVSSTSSVGLALGAISDRLRGEDVPLAIKL